MFIEARIGQNVVFGGVTDHRLGTFAGTFCARIESLLYATDYHETL